jgi:hypothetical protein
VTSVSAALTKICTGRGGRQVRIRELRERIAKAVGGSRFKAREIPSTNQDDGMGCRGSHFLHTRKSLGAACRDDNSSRRTRGRVEMETAAVWMLANNERSVSPRGLVLNGRHATKERRIPAAAEFGAKTKGSTDRRFVERRYSRRCSESKRPTALLER